MPDHIRWDVSPSIAWVHPSAPSVEGLNLAPPAWKMHRQPLQVGETLLPRVRVHLEGGFLAMCSLSPPLGKILPGVIFIPFFYIPAKSDRVIP